MLYLQSEHDDSTRPTETNKNHSSTDSYNKASSQKATSFY